MPKLSVIVPVYKVEKYIHQCLDSLLAQDYEDMEILLIDDGSPDRCGAICDDYAKRDARIRVIHQENQGLAEVRNIGIREAMGAYIGFVDSDDYVQPGMFSEMMDCIEKDNQVDIVICDYVTFPGDEIDQQTMYHQGIDTTNGAEAVRDAFLMDRYSPVVWNKIYSKNLFGGGSNPQGFTFGGCLCARSGYCSGEGIRLCA